MKPSTPGSLSEWYWLQLPWLVAAAVAYYGLARASLHLALVGTNVTPLWPPTGIAVATLLLLGWRAWPAIAVPALLVNFFISGSSIAAFTIAGGNTLAPVVCVMLLKNLGFDWDRGSRRDSLLIIVAALAATIVSAGVGSISLFSSGVIERHEFVGTWLVWWTGDSLGVLAVAPVVLSLRDIQSALRDRRRLLEASALLSTLATTAVLAALSPTPRLFLLIPIVGVIAWRLERLGAVVAVLTATSIVAWAAANDLGSFENTSTVSKMVTLQGFNIVVALSSLVFAAVIAEQRFASAALARIGGDLASRVLQATTDLEATNVRLEAEVVERTAAQETARFQAAELIEAQAVAHIGSWSWDVPDDRVSWSDELYRIYGLDRDAFDATFSAFVERVHPTDRVAVQEAVSRALREGGAFEFAHRIVRPSGDVRSVLSQGLATHDTDGTPVRLIGTAQDITDRLRAEQLTRVEAERLRLEELFLRSPAAVIITKGPDHVIDFVNPAFFAVVGVRDCLGKPVGDAIPELEPHGFLDLFGHVYQSGETSVVTEAPLIVDPTGDGSREEFFLNFTCQPVFGDMRMVEGIFGHGVDVTDMVNARAKVETMAEEVNRLYERELEVAGVLQRSLLPDRLPEIPGMKLAGRYAPGNSEDEVGGDWYDAVLLPDGQLVMMIGDVEGHGVEAAATMGRLRNAMRAYLVEGAGPGEAIDRLRRLLVDTDDESFATVLCASLDTRTRLLRASSAGHLPALRLETRGSARLWTTALGAPIGAPTTSLAEESSAVLECGSSLVLFTDGLVERRGVDIDERLRQLVESASAAPAGADLLADWLMSDLGQGRSDDIALLALSLDGGSPGSQLDA